MFILRKLFPRTKFLMFEAFADFSNRLESVQKQQGADAVNFAIEVLSEIDGKEVSFWAEGKTGNSMFPQLLGNGGKGHREIAPVTRITKTLDSARKESFLADERIDLLKIDVQGAELEVLKGATELLQEVSFVQFEASVVEYNRGGSCYFHVDEFLREHGFYLYDLGDPQRSQRLFRTTGLGQYDSLYVRPSSEHLPETIKNLGPNLCGTGNYDNQPLPLVVPNLGELVPSNSTTSMEVEEALKLQWIEAAPGVVVPHHPVLNYLGTLLVGILVGRFLVPRRSKGTTKTT